nr:histidine phosphatase family protein [Rhizobium sp. ARZ01]
MKAAASSTFTRRGPQLFRDGCPGGETPADVGARADRVLARVSAIDGDVLLFSSGQFLRTLTARGLGLAPAAGRYFQLSTASVSILGFEQDGSDPVIRCGTRPRRCANDRFARAQCDRDREASRGMGCSKMQSVGQPRFNIARKVSSSSV